MFSINVAGPMLKCLCGVDHLRRSQVEHVLYQRCRPDAHWGVDHLRRSQAEEHTGRRAHRSHSEHRKGPVVVDYSPIAQVPTEVELVAHEEGELTNTSFGHAFMSWSRPTPSLLTLIRSLLTLIRSLLTLIRARCETETRTPVVRLC